MGVVGPTIPRTASQRHPASSIRANEGWPGQTAAATISAAQTAVRWSVSEKTPDRRQFGRTVTALAAGVAGAAGFQAAAAEPGRVALPDALAEIVRSRFGEVLTEDQQKRLVGSLVRGRLRATALNTPPLDNGDDPAAAFRADL